MTVAYELDLTPLHATLDGAVYGPHDAGWDTARQAFMLGADQQPAAVVVAASDADVRRALRFARAAGLRVAPQATGHSAAPLAPFLGGSLLLKTSRLRAVELDPAARRVRVAAGTRWGDVLAVAGRHGLAALHGSSPTVGVVGYTLGGGIGWLARRHGLQANSVTAVELITADGELIRTDDDHDPELFWALRGGGGSFGVVTAVEFDLYPVIHAYAGWLAWDWREADRVLRRWADWATTAPGDVTTSARIVQLPPQPELPEEVRGRRLVAIDGAALGDPWQAEALLSPLRELRPEIDTFATVPAAALARLHLDPEDPFPAVGDARLLTGLPPAAVEAFVEAAGPSSGSTLTVAELRQLGGALARTPQRHGVLARLDAGFLLFGLALAPDAESAEVGAADAARLTAALDPWSSELRYRNFAKRPLDAESFFGRRAARRLAAIKTRVDPLGLIQAEHPLEAAA
jgi:FAD/FMN-containing dehydrogenase